MSATLTPSPPPRARGKYRRRQGRLSRPGVSLLAQGESMIWFTGGALVTCVMMITGLLMLVVWSGLPSFWPVPLVQLEQHDGQKVLGEITRDEEFEITRDSLASLSPGEIPAAEKLLTGRDSASVRRRYLRVGNFDLSGEHFRWVSDLAAKENGESRPEWAVAVERLEWGRFFGEPKAFSVLHRRPQIAAEVELSRLADFLLANRWRVPADQNESFDKALEKLNELQRKTRQQPVADFTKKFSPDSARSVTALLDSGESIAVGDVKPEQNVTQVREQWNGAADTWRQYQQHHSAVRRRFYERRSLEKDDIGDVNRKMEASRLSIRKIELQYHVDALELATELASIDITIAGIESGYNAKSVEIIAKQRLASDSPLLAFVQQFVKAVYGEVSEQLREPKQRRAELQSQKAKLPPQVQTAIDSFLAVQRNAIAQIAVIQRRISELNAENSRFELLMSTAQQQEKLLSLADIVRAYPANHLSLSQKLAVYFGRWWEYLSDEPREANSEGGILPAIWGTVAMTLVMSLLVVPFGVLAALYLREYARTGLMVSVIRVAISNLAGVPSIVFGVFGLGFFCYMVGAFIDGGPANAGIEPLPPKIWWLRVFVLAISAAIAFSVGLRQMTKPRQSASKWRSWMGYAALGFWLLALGLAIQIIFTTPYFGGFFAHSLPNPTFGKGGLIWASLTLALLTLPVVIVATEEALSAVPNSLREGSYACGASKWQTIRRIVLPHAMPGIMTGMILAMARGAGEVAPLMLVGAVKLQPELPFDSEFPFLHLHRSFMHLGFHIFDLGFQSQNPDAAKPMVFTTTMLLIVLIAVLNVAAIWIRSTLRKRFQMGQF
jgi:phosphate transport system permease protein